NPPDQPAREEARHGMTEIALVPARVGPGAPFGEELLEPEAFGLERLRDLLRRSDDRGVPARRASPADRYVAFALEREHGGRSVDGELAPAARVELVRRHRRLEEVGLRHALAVRGGPQGLVDLASRAAALELRAEDGEVRRRRLPLDVPERVSA